MMYSQTGGFYRKHTRNVCRMAYMCCTMAVNGVTLAEER